jgi:YesN/AraC family two-component response regulator
MNYLKANIDKPLIFSMAGDFTADGKWLHMTRVRDDYEIIIVKKGIVYLQQEEERFELKEGDLVLLEPGLKHKGYALSSKGTSFYWFHFYCSEDHRMINKNEVAADLAMSHNNPYFSGLNSNILIPSTFPNLNLSKISVLFHQLLHLSQSSYYTTQSINYILTSLLIEITEQVISNFNPTENSTSQEDNLQKILQWIQIHIRKNISLQDVAHEFNFSKEYLARYFKKKMGMCMQEYINYLRISDAKELLCKSDLNIKEIAYKLGFVDEKYFLKLFKKYENLTPKQFRNAYNMTFLNNV